MEFVVACVPDQPVGALPPLDVVVAGSTTNDTRHSIELSRRAAEAGVDGILVTAPYYNKPSQAGVQAHVEAIADSTDLPVMLYDIPGRAGIKIETETLIRLADHPKVIALKDAKADFDATTLVLANTDLDVYSGDDGLTLPVDPAGNGIRVTERIEGADFTAITGLPLIALTSLLRERGFMLP
mgnify:CR=1 FL=1